MFLVILFPAFGTMIWFCLGWIEITSWVWHKNGVQHQNLGYISINGWVYQNVIILDNPLEKNESQCSDKARLSSCMRCNTMVKSRRGCSTRDVGALVSGLMPAMITPDLDEFKIGVTCWNPLWIHLLFFLSGLASPTSWWSADLQAVGTCRY